MRLQGRVLRKMQHLRESREVLLKAIQESKIKLGENTPQEAEAWYGLGHTTYLLEEYFSSKDALKNAVTIIQSQAVIDSSDLSAYLMGLGNVLSRIGAYRQALSNHKKALTYLPKGAGILRKANLYSNIGSVYDQLQDYSLAESYKLEGLKLKQRAGESGRRLLVNSYLNLGSLYRVAGLHDQAIAQYEKALPLVHEFWDEYADKIFSIHRGLGMCHLDLRKMQDAYHHFQEAIRLADKRKETGKFDLATNFVHMGLWHTHNGNQELALDNLFQSLGLYQEILGKNSLHLVNNYHLIGMVYRRLGKPQKALEWIQKGLEAASFGFSSESMLENPKLDSIVLHSISNKLIREKATILGKEIGDLSQAHKTINLAIELIEKQSQGYVDAQSSLELRKKTASTFEDACWIMSQAILSNHPMSSPELVFQYSEKAKNALLLQSVRKMQATTFAGIPDSLVNQEIILRKKQGELEQQLFHAQGAGDSSIVNTLHSRLLDVKQQATHLSHQLDDSYPTYFKLKYNTKVARVSQIQEALPANTALLEYFFGKDHLYVILIREDTLIYRQLPAVDKTWISTFRQGIYWQNPHHRDQIDSVSYEDYAYQLFQVLLHPIFEELPRHLIIIPDGPLAYVPFGSLLKEPVLTSRIGYWGTYPYLIRDKTISYAFSATLWLEALNTHLKPAEKPFLGIAPYAQKGKTTIFQENQLPAPGVIYRSDSEQFSPLPSSKEELKQIQKIIGGEIWIDQEARRNDWIKEAPKFLFIHLATHGKIFDQHPDLNRIYFAETIDSMDQEFLTLADLYGIQLNAEMAVLSACETGMGKLLPGEGIASLARGFTYAGAKSVVSTLWKVDDPMTKELMIAFYQNLDTGMDKASALREAKLTILEETYLPPFYWAAPIAMGDMRPIPRQNNLTWWILGMVIVGIGLLVIYRRTQE